MLAIDSSLYATRRRSREHDRDNVSGPVSMKGLVLFQGKTDACGTRNQVGVHVSVVQQKRGSGVGYGDSIYGYRGSGLLALLQPDIRNWFQVIQVFVVGAGAVDTPSGRAVHGGVGNPASRTVYV